MTSETNDANSKPLNLKPYENPGVKATEPSPSEKFKFAKRFLVGVGIFCVVALICSTVLEYRLIGSNEGLCSTTRESRNTLTTEAVWELMKIGVIPLITLVISFYFAKNSD